MTTTLRTRQNVRYIGVHGTADGPIGRVVRITKSGVWVVTDNGRRECWHPDDVAPVADDADSHATRRMRVTSCARTNPSCTHSVMASQTQLVAANIRAEMARKRIAQKTVAEELGITQQSVSLRLNGRVPIDVDELAVFARLLDVPMSALLEPVAVAS